MNGFDHTASPDAIADVFARTRDQFVLPEGMRYFDGNSLGPLPKAAQMHAYVAVTHEWGQGLIRSWHDAQWNTLPRRVGDRIATLIGAEPGEVVACDSTSVNLFKVLCAAARLRRGRTRIITDAESFPTDLYIAAQVAKLFDMTVTSVPAAQIPQALGNDVAIVLLNHVDYRSAQVHSLETHTRAAHDAGALMVCDLSHSAGAMRCDLNLHRVDFAVGCGYKYLNGGPGAPAFLYAARRHHADCEQPLAGWFGHAQPFDFQETYVPAPGIERFLCGTNPVLALSILERSLQAFDGISLDALRARSLQLTGLFIEQAHARLSRHGFEVASPAQPEVRGSHVSLRHPNGYAVMQELARQQMIGDFRMPDFMRFGFAPLFNSEADVTALVDAIDNIMVQSLWDRPEHLQRRAFT